jgi:hypothetical protein
VHVHQGTNLAARQVKGHHQIPVILPSGGWTAALYNKRRPMVTLMGIRPATP